MLARRHEIAHRIFVAIVIIGTLYAVYGFILSAAFTSQATLFEQTFPPPYWRDVTGAFVAKNSFATYTGISLLASVLLVVNAGRRAIVVQRGPRQLALSTFQFALGAGVFPVLAMFILFVALVASDSRAGLLATLAGLFVLFLYGVRFAARRGTAAWAVGAGAATIIAMVVLVLISGRALETRIDAMIETSGGVPELRPVMWGAAMQAISDHPWLGSGLGTFRDTYLLYADRFDPFVFDRVHNDYLEFALGVGVPAAAVWVLAMVWLTAICAVGVLRRHRRQIYALGAVGASVLVGVHSIFDFSLQMPAVSLLYAIVLGVGLAQSERASARRAVHEGEDG